MRGLRRWGLLAVLAGCGGSAEPAPAPPSPGPVDFEAGGPATVTATDGSLEVEGCTLFYTAFVPTGGEGAPLVVLGHGFARNQARMAGLAEHVASFGVRVVTPQYCFLSASNVDHEANGRHAEALSEALAAGAPVVQAGYSAGGLAAVLAGASDPRTVAVLALDWVDSEGLGAAAPLDVPTLGLFAEPSECNAEGNGAPLFDGGERWGARLVGATHCDFEDPTDAFCTAICGDATAAAPVVRTMAAAFVGWQVGGLPSGEAWASPDGAEWRRLVEEGVLSPP